jgi:hypothetical protein
MSSDFLSDSSIRASEDLHYGHFAGKGPHPILLNDGVVKWNLVPPQRQADQQSPN